MKKDLYLSPYYNEYEKEHYKQSIQLFGTPKSIFWDASKCKQSLYKKIQFSFSNKESTLSQLQKSSTNDSQNRKSKIRCNDIQNFLESQIDQQTDNQLELLNETGQNSCLYKSPCVFKSTRLSCSILSKNTINQQQEQAQQQISLNFRELESDNPNFLSENENEQNLLVEEQLKEEQKPKNTQIDLHIFHLLKLKRYLQQQVKLNKILPNFKIIKLIKLLNENSQEIQILSKRNQNSYDEDSQKKPHQCQFCNKSFQVFQQLGGHVSRYHKGESLPYEDRKKKSAKRKNERIRKQYFVQLCSEIENQ